MYLEGSNFVFFKKVAFCSKMDPLGPMEARPTCFSTLFLNYFQDLEKHPRYNSDESEAILSRNVLTASRFNEKMRTNAENDDDDDSSSSSSSSSSSKTSTLSKLSLSK